MNQEAYELLVRLVELKARLQVLEELLDKQIRDVLEIWQNQVQPPVN